MELNLTCLVVLNAATAAAVAEQDAANSVNTAGNLLAPYQSPESTQSML